MSERAYYFGCWRNVGHDFYWPGTRSTPYKEYGQNRERPEEIVPWGYGVDGSLEPSGRQSEAAIHHKDGWTALAMCDRTVDSRPGSCSVFLFEAVLDFDEALERARRQFGAVTTRIEATHPIFDTGSLASSSPAPDSSTEGSQG